MDNVVTITDGGFLTTKKEKDLKTGEKVLYKGTIEECMKVIHGGSKKR
jgi:hypothetical protein